MSHKTALAAFSVLLGLSLPAQADYINLKSTAPAAWQTVEETDAVLQTPVCRAWTAVSNSADAVELSLSYPKDGAILPMIGLKTRLAPALIAIQISKKETEYFLPLLAAASAEQPNVYWYAPVNFSRLESLIKDQSVLNLILDPRGAAVPVQVSLKGSGNAVEAAHKCLGKTKIPTDFFKALNAAKDDLNPDLGDRNAAVMFTNVQNALTAFRAGQAVTAELAKLRKANESTLSKERSAQAVVKKASDAFNAARTKLETATQRVADLTRQLADSQTQLAELQAEKPRAEADLAAKKAVYLPLKQQMAPYEQNVATAAAAVKKTAKAIQDNEELIAYNTRTIPRLEAERSQLLRQIPGLQSRVRSTRSDYDDADREYRSYDVRREAERFLNNDSSYSWAKRDLDNAKRDLSDAQSKVNQAQSKLGSAQGALQSCLSNPATAANCSSQQSAVSQAQSEVYQAQSSVSSAQSQISSAEWRIRNAEDDAQRKANSEADRLRRIRDSAESDYNSASYALRSAESRAQEIRVAIPRMRAQITRAEAELPGQRDLLTQQKADLAARTAERDQFADSIGFPAAEKAFNDATDHLAAVNKGILDLTKAIPKITKDLAATQKTIPGLTKTHDQTKAALAAAEAKLAPITEQLKPFRELEKVQVDALAAEAMKFKTAKAVYQILYAELTH